MEHRHRNGRDRALARVHREARNIVERSTGQREDVVAQERTTLALGFASLPIVAAGYVVDDNDAARRFLQDVEAELSPHTYRSYAKECLRFLLWLRATKGMLPRLLPELTGEDVRAYKQFLAAPTEFDWEFLEANGWTRQPFGQGSAEGRDAVIRPLLPSSIRLAITILNGWLDDLVRQPGEDGQPYVRLNPITKRTKRKPRRTNVEMISSADALRPTSRALAREEIHAIFAAIEALPRESPRDLEHHHRCRWTIALLYRAFLRREEAARLTMNAFRMNAGIWELRVLGKGDKLADIACPQRLLQELTVYRKSLGLPALPSPDERHPAIFAIGSNSRGVDVNQIYRIVRTVCELAAQRVEHDDPAAAHRLRAASPHWFRHAGITHALDDGVPARYVQSQARHESLTTTSRYDHQHRRDRAAAMDMMG